MTFTNIKDTATRVGVSYSRLWYAVRVGSIIPQVVLNQQCFSDDDLPRLRAYFDAHPNRKDPAQRNPLQPGTTAGDSGRDTE